MADKEVKSAVKAHLRQEKVKLWEPPHTDAEGNNTVTPELIETIASKLSLDVEAVATAVEALRSSAVKKAQKRASSAPSESAAPASTASAAATPVLSNTSEPSPSNNPNVANGAPLSAAPPSQPQPVDSAGAKQTPSQPAPPSSEVPSEPQPSTAPEQPSAEQTTPTIQDAPIPAPQSPVETKPQIIPPSSVPSDESAAAASANASASSVVVASPSPSSQATSGQSEDAGASDEPYDPFNESVHAPTREEVSVQLHKTTLTKATKSSSELDLDLADPDQVLSHQMQIVTSKDSPKIKRKDRKLTNMFKSKRKKDAEVEQMISFDNDAYFLAQQAAEAMTFKPRHPDEEPAYFDDLTPEQQAAYEKRVSIMMDHEGGSGGLFDPFADVPEPAVVDDKEDDDDGGDSGDGDDTPGPADNDESETALPTREPAPLATTDEFGDEADDFLSELPPSEFTPASSGGWKRSLSGKHLVAADSPQGSAASSTDQDAMALDGVSHGDSSTDSHKSRRLLSGFKSIKKKLRGSRNKSSEKNLLPPAAPVVQPSNDFVANEMRMTDAQRIAVMSMVRDGKLSIEQAIEKVLAVEELLEESESPQVDRKTPPSLDESIAAGEVRIADSARKAIMDQVKSGHLTVDEAIQMILDAEDEIAIAQGFKRRNTVKREQVTKSMIFDDEDLAYMAAQRGDTLTSATSNRPRPQHRKPDRDVLRKSMLAKADVYTEEGRPVSELMTSTEVPATTAAPARPQRRKKKKKGSGELEKLPEVEVKFHAPDFKASELHLTPDQQLQVMALVKEGKLTMDQAMEKVMKVEADVQRQQAGPQIDSEGFTVVDETAPGTEQGAFDAAFKAEQEDSSDDDDDDDRPRDGSDDSDSDAGSPRTKSKFRLRINSKPSMDVNDPFASGASTSADDPFGNSTASAEDKARNRLSTSVVREAFDETDEFVLQAAKSTEDLTLGLAVVGGAGPVDPFAVQGAAEPTDVEEASATETPEPAAEEDAQAAGSEDEAGEVKTDTANAAAAPAAQDEPAGDASNTAIPAVEAETSNNTIAEQAPSKAVIAAKLDTPASASPSRISSAPDVFDSASSASSAAPPPAAKPKPGKPAPPPVARRRSSTGDVSSPPAPKPKPRGQRSSTMDPTAKQVKPGPPVVSKPKPAALAPKPAAKPKVEKPAGVNVAELGEAASNSAAADVKAEPEPEAAAPELKADAQPPATAATEPANAPNADAVTDPTAPAPAASTNGDVMAEEEQVASADQRAKTEVAPAPAAKPRKSAKARLQIGSSLPDEPVKSKPKPQPAAPAASRSKIYQALNAQPLWAETEEDKKRREAKNQVVGVGSGASQRAAAALLVEDEVEGLDDLEAADDRIEALREQARSKMEDFAAAMGAPKSNAPAAASAAPEVKLRKKKPKPASTAAAADFNPFASPAPAVPTDTSEGSPGSRRNSRLSTASSDFNDDDFMAELNRRRQERAEQERLHAEELRKQHEARQAKEQAERQKIIDAVNAQKREEEEKERKRKSTLYKETLATAQDMKFDFKFGD